MKTLYANGLPSPAFIYCLLLIVFSLTLTLVQAQTAPFYPPEVKNPSNQTNVNGIWYYTADYYRCDNYHYDGEGCLDFTIGYELWRSNGTASGTIKLKVYANYGSSEHGMPLTFASTFMAVNDYLYFINGEDTDYITLCRIDNSSIEPTIIKTFYISQYRSYFYARMYQSPADYHLTLVNGLLYFTLDDDGDSPIYGTELWKTDGTTAGTLMVKDIRAGGESSASTDLRTENNLLYFTADDGNGRRLWKTDGTAAGTVKTVLPTGKITREYWDNVSGTLVSTIPLTTIPTSTSQITSFEGPTNSADNYGQRIRGYIRAPVSGNYMFWIASDDNSELWLSTDESPANRRKIASVSGYTASRQWDKFASQKSSLIALQAGKSYYIETLHKEGSGGDNLAVGWQLPNGTFERPIPGNRLSPVAAPVVSLTKPAANAIFTTGMNIPLSATAEEFTGSISKVEFFANTIKLGEDTTYPYTYNWNNVPTGTYKLTAKAFNHLGVSTTSAGVGITNRQIPGTAKAWDKTFGGSAFDDLKKVIESVDGGYLLSGLSHSEMSGDKSQVSKGGYDYWIIKTDAYGNKLWDKTFGGSGNDELFSVIQTGDGGYLLGGISNSNLSGDKSQASRGAYDYWIIKIDARGNKEWDKTFGGNLHDHLTTLSVTHNGGYLLGGYSLSGMSGDKSAAGRGSNDYWLVKIDINGNKLWDKTFGGVEEDYLTSIIQMDGNSYLLGGTSASGISHDRTQASKGGYDYWVVKINDNGDKVWDKAYGGTGLDWLVDIIPTKDGNYFLTGNTSSNLSGDKTEAHSGFWILKLNTLGNKVWDKTIAHNSGERLSSAALTLDGGLLLATSSSSAASANKTEDSRGEADFWIIKVNSTGQKQWDRTFGGTQREELFSVIATKDGAYVLAGESNSFRSYEKSEDSRGYDDYWIVKTTPDPQVPAPLCTASGSITREYWANIAGKEITTIPVNSTPASTSQLNSFEAPSSIGDNYGQRIRGYICAPVSGNYTFYIASDDNSELWLSSSDSPSGKRKIASLTGWARNGDWNKYPSQKSATINLEKGRKYYIEALHKEATGGDNLAVAWAIPGSGSISIIPGAVLSPVVPTAIACSATGSILREYWSNVRGGAVSDIPLTTAPTSSTQISSFETPSNIGDNYGQRIRGYICAPATGSYTFYLASDDQGELWLSSSESPASKQKIAYLTAHTSARQWAKYASQKSVSITLEKGKKYYIEALHKEAVYGDNLAVGWTIPGSSSISVIPGSVLSPFVPSAARLAGEAELQAIPLVVYPNPFSEKLTIATSGQEGKVTITLTDVVGKTYFVKEYVLSGQSKVELALTGLSLKVGLHLLKLQTEDGEIKVIKVVKR